jgi:hypothetical protein
MKTTLFILLTGLTSISTALAVDPPLDDGSDSAQASWIWRHTGSLNTTRQQHTATLLQNGRVLVAGGLDTNNRPLTRTELGHGHR